MNNQDPRPDPNAAPPINCPAGADWRELQPQVVIPKTIDEAEVIGFCGYLTAELPQLHGIHPQRVLDAWERYKAARASGFTGLFIDQNGEG